MRVTLCVGAFLAVAANKGEKNPIRHVVSLLQQMQAKIEEEEATDAHLFAKYECFCKKNTVELTQAIEDGKAKITDLQSQIEATKEGRTQAIADLQQAKDDRAAAKQAVEEATKVREKEAADYASESGDIKANIGALNQAIPAIEKGMGGSFLQTPAAAALQRAVSASVSTPDYEKTLLQSFFQQADGQTAPQSGEIVGILKTMKEEMEKALAEITRAEDEAKVNFAQLKEAKAKEVAAATRTIEKKTEKSGEMAVEVTQLEGDLQETESTLEEDTGYSNELDVSCKEKAADYESIKVARADELVAIADTIKLLNSDEALELFKKALPSSGSSLVELNSNWNQVRAKALAALRESSRAFANPKLDLITMALSGKKEGFEKVLGMIEKMVKELELEQTDDDAKKAFCESEIDKTEDKSKDQQRNIDGLATDIDAEQGKLGKLQGEVVELKQAVADTDKAVQEQTEQRKEEHEEYTSTAASDNAALELLEFAKNRLNKFYSPEQYKAPPKRQLTEEEEIYENYSFVQIHRGHAAPEAPEAPGDYKKSSKSNGVVAMIDLLREDLKKEMQKDAFEEKEAQKDYEKFMDDAARKRATDSKAITQKQEVIADVETELHETKGEHKTELKALQDTKEYEHNLHMSCDWLSDNFDERKQARTEEIESLKKARDVINGADYSLVQAKASQFMGK